MSSEVSDASATLVAVEQLDGVDVMAFADGPAWEAWLAEHHDHQPGVWLKLAKRGSGIASVTDDELVDIGLCWGWISGQRRSFDAQHYLQKYVPRRPRSLWSQVNVDKVAILTAAGRMREPGLVEVRAAQADGRWAAAYPGQRNAAPPHDFLAALDADASARAAFDALDRSAQYQTYLPILQALNATTRQARIARAVETLRAAT